MTGGNFGVWGGMFSTFDCAIKGWRQKEDAWNAIASGFLTGGCLAARSTFFPPVALRHGNAYSHHSRFRWPEVCARFSSRLRYPLGCVRGCWSLGFQDYERQHSPSTPSLARKHATTTVIIAVMWFHLDAIAVSRFLSYTRIFKNLLNCICTPFQFHPTSMASALLVSHRRHKGCPFLKSEFPFNHSA